MTADDNLRTLQRYREERAKEQPDFSGVFADDFFDHDAADDQPPGPEGLVWYWRGVEQAFPDFRIEQDEVVATDEWVVTITRLTGTQAGDFMGYPSTGQRIDVRMLQALRFRDGLIVARYGSTDQLSILQQLGVLPEPPESDDAGWTG